MKKSPPTSDTPNDRSPTHTARQQFELSALSALGRQLAALEAIAADAKAPAPERMHAIELIGRFAGLDVHRGPKHHGPKHHGPKHGPKHEGPRHGPKHHPHEHAHEEDEAA